MNQSETKGILWNSTVKYGTAILTLVYQVLSRNYLIIVMLPMIIFRREESDLRQDVDCVSQQRKPLNICFGGATLRKEFGDGLRTSSRSIAILVDLSNLPTSVEAEVSSSVNCGL